MALLVKNASEAARLATVMFSKLGCIVITLLAVTRTAVCLQCYFSHGIAGAEQIGVDGIADATADGTDDIYCAKFQLICGSNVPLMALQEVCTSQVTRAVDIGPHMHKC
jgi:hypothetical protein